MTAPRDIDAATGRLDEALRGAQLPGLEPPADVTPIAAIADEIAPYVLPAELRRFWEQVDAERIAVFTFPMLRGPAYALDLLRGLRELEPQFPIGPSPIPLPFEYASHCYGVIELESEWCDGGTIFEWEFDALPIVSHSLADRIALLAELLADGHFERGDDYVSIDHRVELEKRTAHLDAAGPHPVYGDLRAIPLDLESWPAHWLVASGIDLGDREPLGATHTISALVALAGKSAPVTGRIHGDVTSLTGSGAGALVVVDDGTMALEVWCPSGTSPWGPVHRRRFEFEVTIESGVGPSLDLEAAHAAISNQALAGNSEGAQAAAERFERDLQEHRSAAVASGIRPLD